MPDTTSTELHRRAEHLLARIRQEQTTKVPTFGALEPLAELLEETLRYLKDRSGGS